MNKVIIITGPTGTGKTKLSIEVAKKYHTEIINGDAYQVYKNMDILTAKVTNEEKQNIPHHLFDIKEPTEEYSVAEYQQNVRNLISEFENRNLIPLIVGGSGLYLDSVIYDYDFSKVGRNNETETKYCNLTNEELHKILESLNTEAAHKIHMNNRKRVLRAIELAEDNAIVTKFNNRLLYDPLIIFLNEDRDKLYNALNKRVDKMIEEGLLDEVKELSLMNLSKTAQKAIGYKEFIAYFNGEKLLDECVDEVKKNTRHYAKRQITWFKNKPNITILDINRDDFQETINKAFNIIDNFFKK